VHCRLCTDGHGRAARAAVFALARGAEWGACIPQSVGWSSRAGRLGKRGALMAEAVVLKNVTLAGRAVRLRLARTSMSTVPPIGAPGTGTNTAPKAKPVPSPARHRLPGFCASTRCIRR
jgi:hypothetical protein